MLAIERGIEVGHVFQLGTADTESMKASFLDETGKPAALQMGCYGIGVSRILGARLYAGDAVLGQGDWRQ